MTRLSEEISLGFVYSVDCKDWSPIELGSYNTFVMASLESVGFFLLLYINLVEITGLLSSDLYMRCSTRMNNK